MNNILMGIVRFTFGRTESRLHRLQEPAATGIAEPAPEWPTTSWTAPAVIRVKRACSLCANQGGTAEAKAFVLFVGDGSLFILFWEC